MKLILAQGNPGTEYTQTRHNVGWILLDALAKEQGTEFKPQPKFSASIATTEIDGEKVLFVKPTTFYNETGRAARALTDFYKLDPATGLLVLHDDIALPFGTIRIRQKGSDAGNNGVKSLNAHLGHDYWRMRVGIWSEHRERMHDADFVLGKLSATEKTTLTADIYPYIHQQIVAFTSGRLEPDSFSLPVEA